MHFPFVSSSTDLISKSTLSSLHCLQIPLYPTPRKTLQVCDPLVIQHLMHTHTVCIAQWATSRWSKLPQTNHLVLFISAKKIYSPNRITVFPTLPPRLLLVTLSLQSFPTICQPQSSLDTPPSLVQSRVVESCKFLCPSCFQKSS